MSIEPAQFTRIRVAAGIDNLATGTVGAAFAVVLASGGGLSGLGLVLSVRVVAIGLFAWWSHRSSAHSGTLPVRTLWPSAIAVSAASLLALVGVCAGAPLWALILAYLLVTTANAMSALQISSRAPRETARLAPVGAVCLAVGSSLSALSFAAGGAGLLLAVGSVIVLAQMGIVPLLRGCAPASAPVRAGARQELGLAGLGVIVGFVCYAPLVLTGGIVAGNFGAGWVAPVLLLIAGASFLAPAVQRRLGHRPLWVLGVLMAGVSLSVTLVPLGLAAYLAGRLVVSALTYGVDGSLRTAAFEKAGVRGLAAISTGITIGLSASLPLFGFVADSAGMNGAGALFAGFAMLFSVAVRAGTAMGRVPAGRAIAVTASAIR